MKRITLILIALAALAPASAHAQANFFPGEIIDGPNADLVSVGDLDLARDGTGAVAFVKRDSGVEHVFVSRLVDGAFVPPERVDAGLDAAGSDPAVAASDGGRLIVAFSNGGTVYAQVRPAGGNPGAPQPLGAGANPSADMSFNGAAYVVWSGGGDVRAARLDRTSTTFSAIGSALDVDPAQPAGDSATRLPQVAISADGTGLATWGETGGDGRTHVYARRLFGMSISTAPQDLTLDDFNGHGTGSADSPHLSIEDDSSFAWVTYRQVVDGTARVVARRLVGSAFDPPIGVDGMGFPADEPVDPPSFAMSGRGVGLAVTARAQSNSVWVSPLVDDTFGKGTSRVDSAANTIDPKPIATFAENLDGFIAWLQQTSPTDPVTIQGRIFDNRQGLLPGGFVTKPDLGSVDASAGFDADGDRANDVAIVAIQGTGADRKLVANMIDRAPAPSGSFVGHTTQKYRRPGQLSWAAAFDLWGPLTYTVFVDDQPIGQTTDTKLVPATPIADGRHRWKVVATDRRGQTLTTKTRLLQVDGTPPQLTVSTSGSRKAGKLLKFRFRAGDPNGSGLARIRVEWGDGTTQLTGAQAAHRFRRGKFTVRVSATDKAGNAVVVTKRLTIKKR